TGRGRGIGRRLTGVEIGRRSTERGARVGPDAFDHGSEPVRALRRQMLVETERAEHGVRLDVEDLLGGFAVVEREQNGDEPAHDMRVAIADEGQDGPALTGTVSLVAPKPDLARASPNFRGLGLEVRGHVGEIPSKLDDVAITVLPVVEQL